MIFVGVPKEGELELIENGNGVSEWYQLSTSIK